MKTTRKDIPRRNRNAKQGVNKKKQKVINMVSIEYYEKKIVYLNSRTLHPRLVMLACSDAPIRPDNISCQRGLKRHVKKCIKYYEKKLTNLNREQKKLFTANFFDKFFLGAA
ncbi:MAG: hypothetical protein KAJ45_04005 [Desulfobulbaceae bacterium]|nr:hypothetical protein [Desulfobulbaceae bacterium]MCK5437283.1 hypothetical protein [Desulfobulbaceae bacterium]MCK5545463.1 hypothetical protein [Desulfobulbaceae bacterium]